MEMYIHFYKTTLFLLNKIKSRNQRLNSFNFPKKIQITKKKCDIVILCYL